MEEQLYTMLKETVDYLRAEVKELEEKYSSSRRLIYDRLEELEKSSAIVDERYTRILSEIEEIKAAIKPLTDKPHKRWDTAITAVITATVGGVVGFVVSKIFGG